MANKQIKDYSEETTMVAGDWFLAQKGTTNVTNKVSASNILPAGSVGTVDLANDAVTATKIDWASTGADGGIWWEELGRSADLGAEADTISVSSFPARTNLKVIAYVYGTGSTTENFTFNSDTAANYSHRYSTNGAADTSAVSQAYITNSTAGSSAIIVVTFEILNIAAKEKLVFNGSATRSGSAGAGNAVGKDDFAGKWANTSDQVTTITMTNSSTGGYLVGTKIIVLGHN